MTRTRDDSFASSSANNNNNQKPTIEIKICYINVSYCLMQPSEFQSNMQSDKHF